MRRNFFNNHEELCERMIDIAHEGMCSVAVLFYNDAIKLMREIIAYDDIEVEALKIEPYKYNGYDKEYYVTLTNDMVITVEPAFVGGRYLDAIADLTLTDSNANSEILRYLDENKCYEIRISEYRDDLFA